MTSACRVLVIGRNGQLATELRRARWPDGWSMTSAGNPELDLAAPDRAADFVSGVSPDLVINAAAYTDVERAENEPERARLINARGPAAVARACHRIGAPFVMVSTDYVFNGSKATPYAEDDSVGPLSAYGRSKAEGEALVRAAAPRHLILRTSWLFSPFGGNFVKTMRRLGRERPTLRVVADQQGCPTSAADLAQAAVSACAKLRADNGPYGTFHVANGGSVSWHGFAAAIFEGLAARGEPVPSDVVAITAAEYPARAKRPANSVLDCSRFERAFGVTMRPWQAALSDCLDELAAAVPNA